VRIRGVVHECLVKIRGVDKNECCVRIFGVDKNEC
jgi:hypothetical protein